MHELSVATEILDVAQRYAQGKPIRKIVIKAGPLSGVVKESLEFYLNLLFEDKGIKGAVADIQQVPCEAKCSCGNTYETPDPLSACPVCGGLDREFRGGKDCLVDSIEVAQ